MESSQTLENASIKILPANKSLSDSLSSDYVELNEKLQSMNMYEPLFINDYMPADQYLKRKWLNNIALHYPVCMYCYAYGNNLGTIIYLWRIPEGEIDQSITSRIFAQLSRSRRNIQLELCVVNSWTSTIVLPKCQNIFFEVFIKLS